MKHAIGHIHFVGIGGAGMSGIAEVLFRLGYRVTGSDMQDSSTLQRLSALGIATHLGHACAHVHSADAVVASSAVPVDNPELVAARGRGIPVVPRAQMLAELMRCQRGIAVAGTHGKTTTTSLVASVLAEAGLDPSFVIGGRLNSVGANAHLGQGDYIVVEADESDASFLCLSPVLAIVTNIDADHMETYGHDFARLQRAFVEFLQRLPFYGSAIVCTDDAGVRDIVPQLRCSLLTYGFDESAQTRALDVRAVGTQMHFTVRRQALPTSTAKAPDLQVVLNLAGRHNVLNALAAIALAQKLGVPDSAVLSSLAKFQGVGRRLQSYGELPCRGGGSFTLLEDYGHHPVEMTATLAAIRGAYPGRRVVLAFQPHRYTRTRDCFAAFVQVLAQADHLLLSEVYAAGEAHIASATGSALAQAVQVVAGVLPQFVADMATMPASIWHIAQAGDVVLCMGAGSMGDVPAALVTLIQGAAISKSELIEGSTP